MVNFSYQSGEYFLFSLTETLPDPIDRLQSAEEAINPERPVLRDLDQLPFPAWDMLPLENLFNPAMVARAMLLEMGLLSDGGTA